VQQVKVIVEKHADGYVAYPVGLQGVVVGEGDTYEEALSDVQSAIIFHIEMKRTPSSRQKRARIKIDCYKDEPKYTDAGV
jgi:predicted RNase H-like HicB family nuclease